MPNHFTKRDDTLAKLWAQQKWLAELEMECVMTKGVLGDAAFKARLKELAKQERVRVVERISSLLDSGSDA